MGGKSDIEIRAERLKILEAIKQELGKDVKIIDTLFDFGDSSPLFYLAKSIEALCSADIAYFINNWQDYRGCRVEHQCCKEYSIPIRYLTI